jgi:hypothetical protein
VRLGLTASLRDHDEQVDEGAADVEREAEKPQNQQNDEDCPEHEFSFVPRTPGVLGRTQSLRAYFWKW